MNLLQWLMKGLGMTKKKLIDLSKGEENINGDCQSIEEPKGWRFDWRKIIPLEPTAELIILVLLALLYGGFYYYDHYTVNQDNIYGLWQSDHHKLGDSLFVHTFPSNCNRLFEEVLRGYFLEHRPQYGVLRHSFF